jgi:uncharacterized protein YfiM (DUF2279 family)
MPLLANAGDLIRKNLMKIHRGRRAWPVVIGSLTAAQLEVLNAERARRGFRPMTEKVVFVGAHIYNSRVLQDGYSFEDVIVQITGAMRETSILKIEPKMNGLVSCAKRDDGYGNRIIDWGVLECDVRFPRPELISVIPKGDKNKPVKK